MTNRSMNRLVIIAIVWLCMIWALVLTVTLHARAASSCAEDDQRCAVEQDIEQINRDGHAADEFVDHADKPRHNPKHKDSKP